ncbi:unnamed protein product [Haemonchus placei]|uniref:BACK domain-containing protein n=1 Tax=Haemonchus placei TaxID=6290 RepID=A0A0N4WSI5_HAEPC|nr:unnamed protein product [Haemonchus placei]
MQGNWKDSKEDVLHLNFPDENVTREGLHAVLGSLYHNQIEIDLDKVEGVLSAASVLQLESVLERCGEAMAENILPNNVLRYLNLAEMYGLPQVTNKAYHLLKWNFWRFMKSKDHLKELKEDTFIRLISSSELLIMEGEMDIYIAIKMWIFLQQKPHASALPDAEFTRLMNETLASYPPGELFVRYAALFAALRFHHITTTLASLGVVEKDRLIPKEVLRAVMVDQWKTTLTNEENPTAVIISDGTGACLFDSTKQSISLRLDQSVVVARFGDDIKLPVSVHLLYLAAQPAPPSFLYVNQYIKDVVKREDEEEEEEEEVFHMASE